MAEAYARMHLRDYVQEEDLNMAIRMVLESFVETQKYSVMQMQRQIFQRYLLYKKDHSELLLYILRQLTKDQLAFMRGTSQGDTVAIEIDEKDLIDKVIIWIVCVEFDDLKSVLFQAKEINIHDVKPFYKSKCFEANNFVYDSTRKVIVYSVPDAISSED